MEKEKEILNIIIADGSESKVYIDYLNLYFNINVLDATKVKKNSDVDLVLFTGGADVDPRYYKEPIGKYTGIDKGRDNKEISIFDRFNNRPKLGICRGAQFLTVMSNGKLIQHVNGHTSSHKIDIKNYGYYTIPSTHHQMMFPYNLPKSEYDLKAWSSNFISDTYLNGKNEEIELPINFLEPEIIEYFRTNCLCIQGHPEIGDNEIKDVTLRIIKKFLKQFNVITETKTDNENIVLDEIPEEEGYSSKGKAIFSKYVISPEPIHNRLDIDVTKSIESWQSLRRSTTDLHKIGIVDELDEMFRSSTKGFMKNTRIINSLEKLKES